MTGCFAISKAGHDKGQMYIIWEEDSDFVYLVDGRAKGVNQPKKKRKKHIQEVKTGMDSSLRERIIRKETIYNEEIRYAIKCRCREVMHV